MFEAFDNSMGDHIQWFSTGDWLNRPLANEAKRHGQYAPVSQSYPGTPWRNPTSYDRTVINVDQKVPAINRFGLPNNVGEEYSGSLLISHLGGRWSGENPSFDSNMLNETQTKCLLKVADNKAQIGVGVAQGKRTLDELAKSASTLFKAYKALRHGQLGNLLNVLSLDKKSVFSGKSPADYWLQYQYGWKPLFSDLHSYYDAVTSTFEKYDMLSHAISTTKHSHTNEEHTEVNNTYDVNERYYRGIPWLAHHFTTFMTCCQHILTGMPMTLLL
jgi:hypothetical protein